MKQGNLRIMALAGVGLAASAALARAEALAALTLSPGHALNLDVGGTHIAGYFIDRGNQCALVLTVVGAGDLQQASVSHVEMTVGGGGVARLQSDPESSLSFSCDNGAQRMRVWKNDGLSGAGSVE
ncbi:hypothetical protein [Methylocystis iwaonis]|uniref:Uncharacterized protein n=1 Tax=Methylocystis iwaonis TaxID=2885079 RepID=A0ABM8E868_9HYPH|nr:hypothetical protein [Methylocystis iwaonis]BDV34154.1 hypothetical protein SS37A_16830 [Methylocystis iwaonis]